MDRMDTTPALRDQVTINKPVPSLANKGSMGMTIRGLAGPFAVLAQNFAPGTTEADIENAMKPVGGEIVSCNFVKTRPIMIVEMVFASREGAERVIETFNDMTVIQVPFLPSPYLRFPITILLRHTDLVTLRRTAD